MRRARECVGRQERTRFFPNDTPQSHPTPLSTLTPVLRPTSPPQACAKRVENNPEGHCVGQSFDYLHCLDKCVYTKLDKYVK